MFGNTYYINIVPIRYKIHLVTITRFLFSM